MYPLNLEQPWPRNQWWVAASSGEVGRTLMERTILGEPVVMYRTVAGMPVALAGLCPHRLYPMIKGRLKDDAIECGYHGITFNCDGSCAKVPTLASVPPAFQIKSFPAVERWNWIWIWMGDREACDARLIPDLGHLFGPGWSLSQLVTKHIAARYQLMIDNLFDLSHFGYLHGQVMAEVPEILSQPPEMNKQDNLVRFTRRARGMPSAGYPEFLFGPLNSSLIDTDSMSDYHGPSLVTTGGPWSIAGGIDAEDASRHLGRLYFLHALTPQTPNSCFYFGGFVRDFRIDEAQFTAVNLQSFYVVLEQDIAALASIEPYIDKFADTRRELSVPMDSAPARIRRILRAQIEGEMKAATSTPRG